jgi:hypothetical protein
MFWNNSTHQSSSRTILIGAASLFIGAVLCFCGSASVVEAGTISFDYDISFGAVAPDGPTPYATAVFDDGGSPGSVTLTVDVAATVGGADITDLYYNLDPTLDPTSLLIVRSGGDGPVAGFPILTGVDAFQADGDGMYDILMDLPPPPGNNANLFNAGETLIFTITGIGTLEAADFNFLSAPSPGPGGAGPFASVARFQSTGPNGRDSDFVGADPVDPIIPEPSTLILLSLGSLALVARRRGARA